MLSSISRLIQVYVAESGRQPPAALRLLADFLENIEPGITEDLLPKQYRFEASTGSFLDYWGNPIRLVTISPYHYRLISHGSNRKDENGEGDDIVCDFNPLKYVRSKEPNQAQLKSDKHGCCSRRTDANLR